MPSAGPDRRPLLPDAAGITAAWGARRAGTVLGALVVLLAITGEAAGGLPAAARVAHLVAALLAG